MKTFLWLTILTTGWKFVQTVSNFESTVDSVIQQVKPSCFIIMIETNPQPNIRACYTKQNHNDPSVQPDLFLNIKNYHTNG